MKNIKKALHLAHETCVEIPSTGRQCVTVVYLLMNPIISIQITQSKADIVPMLLDVLSWTAHTPIHTDVV